MSDSFGANVNSVEALQDVRAALVKFQERALTAMGDLRQKIGRTVDWLELDRPAYWRDQEHKAYDLLATTRVAFETCRLRTTGGRRSDCIEEKKAFERAKVRMEYVRQKQEAVRKWMVQAGREANEYRSRTSTFQRALENDIPLMIAQLGRMIDAIEAYSEVGTAHAASSPLATTSTHSITPDARVRDLAVADAEQTTTDETSVVPGTEFHE